MDLQAAKQAVAIVNSKRAVDPVQRALNRIEQPAKTFEAHLNWFVEEIVETQKSEKTRYEWKRQCKHIENKFGSKPIGDIDRRAITEFLDGFPGRASNQYRSLLRQIFTHAVARGDCEHNPVLGTLARDAEVQRQRLTLEGFKAILAKAQPWFQRAMMLALWSLQRREDLVAMRIEHWSNGKLSVRQKKVEGYGSGRLRITPGPLLQSVLDNCLNSAERTNPESIVHECPFLVHRIPEKRRKATGKEHFGQLLPEALSRAFQEARDRLPMFQSMSEAARPTFHEIRALGGDLYRTEHGWTTEQIQALMGHASSKMTREYLDRHGERWHDVVAG